MTDKKQTQEVEVVQTAVDLGIYTPLSVAKEEIWKRWNDQELKKKVEDFLGIRDVVEPIYTDSYIENFQMVSPHLTSGHPENS